LYTIHNLFTKGRLQTDSVSTGNKPHRAGGQEFRHAFLGVEVPAFRRNDQEKIWRELLYLFQPFKRPTFRQAAQKCCRDGKPAMSSGYYLNLSRLEETAPLHAEKIPGTFSCPTKNKETYGVQAPGRLRAFLCGRVSVSRREVAVDASCWRLVTSAGVQKRTAPSPGSRHSSSTRRKEKYLSSLSSVTW
jgi:hypothetical protein